MRANKKEMVEGLLRELTSGFTGSIEDMQLVYVNSKCGDHKVLPDIAGLIMYTGGNEQIKMHRGPQETVADLLTRMITTYQGQSPAGDQYSFTFIDADGSGIALRAFHVDDLETNQLRLWQSHESYVKSAADLSIFDQDIEETVH